MKKILLPLTLLLLIACSNNNSPSLDIPNNGNPIVKSNATYNVIFEENIKYAEGLSHNNVNSSDASIMPLYLDIYTPNNTIENRPLFMFIHGGGFSGGSKQSEQIINMGNYYASRGWVFVSIDYRLKNDKGTVPQEWVDYSSLTPSGDPTQFLAMYPAHRDAKAALRWIMANKEVYKVNPNHVTVGGGSAGAVTAITLGVSNLEDYTNEISIIQDPTLDSTHLDQTYEIHTIIDFWGSKVAVDVLDIIYNHQRFTTNNPPLLIAHGTEDTTVLFSNAIDLKTIYDEHQIPLAYYPLEGKGHGPWGATVNGKRLEELAFDFIVEQQDLMVE
ncbi:Prolyl oligopeptidase family protein [Tenacibaculum sp. MAR_2009_124]|uniref:alpha/beta hydrolase n=1 Tax=Tenacibaculum sp. MAR_2009_124 TaxID=1250059 RepID=UPI00089780D3|nr:alpha/beta hydrolase [Tenacibaculum sp. MAR_2009_124]SEB52080.1 Prolyl oligopeptidase family protein [Tenacibaculum sp. MAR_2009_124]